MATDGRRLVEWLSLLPSPPLTVLTDEAVCIDVPDPVVVEVLEPVVGEDTPEAAVRLTGG